MNVFLREEGIYTVRAMAFDDQGSFTEEMSVVIGNVPCTMPDVKIHDSIKISNSASEFFRSESTTTVAEPNFRCNTSYTSK